MDIRLCNADGRHKDVNNVRDTVKEIQRVFVGQRIVDVAGDLGGDVAYRRTDEIEDGRVIFREVPND